MESAKLTERFHPRSSGRSLRNRGLFATARFAIVLAETGNDPGKAT